MAFSFFRALNPISKHSGVFYSFVAEEELTLVEMIDLSLVENIKFSLFACDLDYFSGLSATYNILLGQHYDLYRQGVNNSRLGAKGVLDYLIFPLIARKLIADTEPDERINCYFSNAMAWTIAIPLELARFSVAIGLTLLLSPLVAIVHLIKGLENTHSAFSSRLHP